MRWAPYLALLVLACEEPCDVALDIINPDSQGDQTDLGLVGAPTNWQAVSDGNTASYVSVTDNSGLGRTAKDCYNLSGLTLRGSQVDHVLVRFKVANPGPGFNNNKATPSLLIGGTEYDGTTINNPPGTDTVFEFTWTTNPSTGLPWKRGDIPTLQVCIELFAGGNPFVEAGDIRCKEIEVEVAVFVLVADLTPNPHTIRVALFQAVDGDATLEALLGGAGQIMNQAHAPPEKRPPRLHLEFLSLLPDKDTVSFKGLLQWRAVVANVQDGPAADAVTIGSVLARASALSVGAGVFTATGYRFMDSWLWEPGLVPGPMVDRDNPEEAFGIFRVHFRGRRL